MFYITNKSVCKTEIEKIIKEQFQSIECAICLTEIKNNQKGVVYITCGGTADLEHIFCTECDTKFEKQDPYKRQIKYRFQYPFVDDEHAQNFVNKSSQFVLNDGNDEIVDNFLTKIKNTVNSFNDVEYVFKL